MTYVSLVMGFLQFLIKMNKKFNLNLTKWTTLQREQMRILIEWNKRNKLLLDKMMKKADL